MLDRWLLMGWLRHGFGAPGQARPNQGADNNFWLGGEKSSQGEANLGDRLPLGLHAAFLHQTSTKNTRKDFRNFNEPRWTVSPERCPLRMHRNCRYEEAEEDTAEEKTMQLAAPVRGRHGFYNSLWIMTQTPVSLHRRCLSVT